jgi:pSer/pThr/pTyr-binding forkhead associated (FHA) protein/Tfp pilus assembly protein PilF
VIIEGKDNRDKGKVITLKKSYIIIGRGQADIVLNDVQVSRAHVSLEFNPKNGELVFTDLGSTNGTLVNGELRKTGSLKDRDKLKVGHTVFDCQLEVEAQTEIGTAAHIRQESQLSKSNSYSLQGPSKLSSDAAIARPQAENIAHKENVSKPQAKAQSEKFNPSELKTILKPGLYKRIPKSARIGMLSLTIILSLFVFMPHNAKRSLTNKSLEGYISDVRTLTESNKLDQAKTTALEAIKAYPNHSVPLVLLGNIYFEQRKLDLAVDSYKKSLALKPIQLITYTRLIRLNLILERKDEAKTLLAQYLPLLASSEANKKLYIQTGELFLDYPELEPNKENLLKRAKVLQSQEAPEDPIGYKLESTFISLSGKSPESIKKAEEVLQKGLALSPKDEWIFDRLFYLKLQLNNPGEAISILESWIKLNPRSTKPLLLFSYLKFNEKNYIGAIPYLQKIMNFLAKEPSHPHYSEALNLMGQISMQQNQLAEAENFLRQSCKSGYKPSCSHPLLVGAPPINEEKVGSEPRSPAKNREPNSLSEKSKPTEKKH